MQNDITPPKTPPKKPRSKKVWLDEPAPGPESRDDELADLPSAEVANESTASPLSIKPLKKKRSKILITIVVILILATCSVGAAGAWYVHQLRPVSEGTATSVRVEIQPGTVKSVADYLHEEGLINSPTAFTLYVRIQGLENQIKTGSYQLMSSESTPEIVTHLINGQAEDFDVTFFPGSALTVNANDTDQTPSHRQVLLRLGYSEQEIDKAFKASYDHPLLVDRPEGSTVEGYIYGQTYNMVSGASVEDILIRTFDEFYSQLEQNDLLSAFEKAGLDLHEATTLASIIEREVSGDEDQRQVAQVFFRRLETDMPLGADATFVYAARINNDTPRVDYDSPYNTRRYGGLPPGPIASPGISSLKAVANPASGDYLYFVSGDDGVNHFSRTLQEHEQNTRRYCKENCQLF